MDVLKKKRKKVKDVWHSTDLDSLLGIRILPRLEKSKLNLNLVDDAPSLDIVPWKLSVPAVWFDLASFKKDTTNPEIYKQLYLNLSLNILYQNKSSPTVLKQRKELLRRLYPQNEWKNFYLSASRRQFNIYSRVEGYSFSSKTYSLFQRKIILDIIWFPFIIAVDFKPKIWSSSLSSDFRIIYKNDERGERDCFHLGSRPCWH